MVKEKKDDSFYKSLFKEEMKDKFDQMDETTLDYAISIVKDDQSDEEDTIASLSPLLEGILEDEQLSVTVSKNIVYRIRDKDSKANGQPAKILGAPVMIARVIESQSAQMKEALSTALPVSVNFNTTMSRTIDDVMGINAELTDKENKAISGQGKKVEKRDKKGQMRERKLAMEREEVLSKLTNKLVKLHETATEQSRSKDIKLENISMGLTALELLRDVTVTFSHGHKYGLVGRNGLGKTTFLKFLAAHAFPGIPKHLQIVHIEQEVQGTDVSVLETVLQTDIERDSLLKESKAIQAYMEKYDKEGVAPPPVDPNAPPEEDPFSLAEMTAAERSDQLVAIYNRLEEIEADTAPPKASAILAGLGFGPEEQLQPTKSFSGGWRMRISLAQALFISPDILLLDEPTNHLDLHSVLWLEEYLTAWPKTLIIVSHDRDFLNSVTTDVVWLHNKTFEKYKGNYDAFEKQRAENLKNQKRAHDAQEKAINHMQEYIDKNRVRAATAKMAQSRLKKLQKIDIIPEVLNDPTFQFSFPEADYMQGPLISILDVSFGYKPDNLLYKDVNFHIEPEARIALVGSNGAGKSTLLKLILSELTPTTGFIKVNGKARIARFSQHHVDQLDMKKTPLQWFQDMNPQAKHQDIRKHLGQMGITGNLALQPIYSLSGGQKSRVAFAHITWKKPHLLLLDEPTNHLDMETVDALIGACNSWNGSLLIVSHDEHLISTVCETIWVCANQTVTAFPGDFDDYKASLAKQNKSHSLAKPKK